MNIYWVCGGFYSLDKSPKHYYLHSKDKEIESKRG